MRCSMGSVEAGPKHVIPYLFILFGIYGLRRLRGEPLRASIIARSFVEYPFPGTVFLITVYNALHTGEHDAAYVCLW